MTCNRKLAGEVIKWDEEFTSLSFADGNIGGAFTVNNSGFVVVSEKLDRETREFYELNIKATDKAGG